MEFNLLEKLIIKGCYASDQYLTLVSTIFKPVYFDDPVIGKMFEEISEHFKKYGQVIPETTLSTDDDRKAIFDEIRSFEFDVAKNYDYLYQETEKYLKEKAVKTAIIDSVNVIDSKRDIISIRTILEDALSKSLKVELGLEYFKNIGDRLRKAFANDVNRIPSYFPQLDEYINGGFPPYTLNVIISRIHGHKSSFMANMSARQVLRGHNVVIMSLEMSEVMYAQRYDGIYSGLNINRMYLDKNMKIALMKALSQKAVENKGRLFIKELPTGKASVNDFRIYLRELQMRHIKPSIVFCDYMNLMKPSYRAKTDMYSDVKDIAEELRALGLEFNCPLVSVSQLNREGSDDLPLSSIDIVHISESMGTGATADSMFIFGNEADMRTYENEIHYKILKNRLGGRVGEINKFYYDAASLTIYDSSELDKWREASMVSGDQRKLKDKKISMPRSLGKKSRKREDEE
jgi:replicative DNA helicase